jgi:hypothetical protein
VLGWAEYRSFDERCFLGLQLAGLAAARATRADDPALILRTRVLFGGICELAVAVATSAHPHRTLRLAKRENRTLTRSLTAAP